MLFSTLMPTATIRRELARCACTITRTPVCRDYRCGALNALLKLFLFSIDMPMLIISLDGRFYTRWTIIPHVPHVIVSLLISPKTPARSFLVLLLCDIKIFAAILKYPVIYLIIVTSNALR